MTCRTVRMGARLPAIRGRRRRRRLPGRRGRHGSVRHEGIDELRLRRRYLDLYVAEDPSMAYEARWLPHERLVDGTWRRFAR